MKSIHDLFNEVRQHPDFVAGVIFVTDDFPNEVRVYDNQRRIEEAMTVAGFETAEFLDMVPAYEDE